MGFLLQTMSCLCALSRQVAGAGAGAVSWLVETGRRRGNVFYRPDFFHTLHKGGDEEHSPPVPGSRGLLPLREGFEAGDRRAWRGTEARHRHNGTAQVTEARRRLDPVRRGPLPHDRCAWEQGCRCFLYAEGRVR